MDERVFRKRRHGARMHPGKCLVLVFSLSAVAGCRHEAPAGKEIELVPSESIEKVRAGVAAAVEKAAAGACSRPALRGPAVNTLSAVRQLREVIFLLPTASRERGARVDRA